MKAWGENWIRDPSIPRHKRFLSTCLLAFWSFIKGIVKTRIEYQTSNRASVKLKGLGRWRKHWWSILLNWTIRQKPYLSLTIFFLYYCVSSLKSFWKRLLIIIFSKNVFKNQKLVFRMKKKSKKYVSFCMAVLNSCGDVFGSVHYNECNPYG